MRRRTHTNTTHTLFKIPVISKKFTTTDKYGWFLSSAVSSSTLKTEKPTAPMSIKTRPQAHIYAAFYVYTTDSIKIRHNLPRLYSALNPNIPVDPRSAPPPSSILDQLEEDFPPDPLSPATSRLSPDIGEWRLLANLGNECTCTKLNPPF